MSILQTPEASFFVYIAIFVGILLVFDGLRQLLSREENASSAINRRMRAVEGGASHKDMQALILNANADASDKRLSARMSRFIKQSGLRIGVYRLLAAGLVLAFIIFLALVPFLPQPVAFALSIINGLGLPFLIVMAVRARRLDKLTTQLPDALDLMARGLEVGHPLSVTVGNVAKDMPDPIGSEFGLIQDQVNYGDDITDAFADFAERVDTEDARYTSVSVGIQHGTGGNLAHVLKVLSQVIRDRSMMRKRIHAISAEGRISAVILSIIPFVIIGTIMTTSPKFYGDVSDDPIFKFFAIAVLVLIAMQAIILNRLVKFKF